MTDETWKVIGIVGAIFVASLGAIGAFIKWHFSEIGNQNIKIHDLEMRLGKLETKYELQQTAIGELPKLLPDLHAAIERVGKEKRK